MQTPRVGCDIVKTDITYRKGTPDDFLETYFVFLAASNDLHRRYNLPETVDTPGRRERVLAFRAHAYRYDPDGFWVAEANGRMVSFGVATVRQQLWFLAALHTVPEYQGIGIGRAVLRHCLEAAPTTDAVLTVMSESFNPHSNALYSQHGMLPWVPIVYLEGSASAVPPPDGIEATRLAAGLGIFAELDRIDREVLGVTRPLDHQHWLSQPGLNGWLFSRRDEAIGYAYVSKAGGVGPLATRLAEDVPPVLQASIAAARAAGAEKNFLPMPGHCRAGLAYLLDLGFRYGPIVNLLLASRPFGHLDRYLHSAGDALF
jgi:GNAT superfamily N-acetyltransferase